MLPSGYFLQPFFWMGHAGVANSEATGQLIYTGVNSTHNFRPSIVLDMAVLNSVTCSGTMNDPYIYLVKIKMLV